ncbi:MAG: flagellar basal-body rod protein FlgF [bacterium]
MIKGIYTSAVGMQSRILEEDITANNLANVNTTGFKKDAVHFKKVLDGSLVILGQNGGEQGLADSQQVRINFAQGELKPTGNSLNAALDGRGFFVVLTEDGEAYTRNGNFMLDSEGGLVTSEGFKVLGRSGPIELFPGAVEIRESGEIYQNNTLVDEFRLVDFSDSAMLEKQGAGLFVSTENRPDTMEAEGTIVRQGYLEESNVNAISEMVRLIMISKAFQAGQKAIQAQDRTLDRAVNSVGRY